jgi:hypothetical protein
MGLALRMASINAGFGAARRAHRSSGRSTTRGYGGGYSRGYNNNYSSRGEGYSDTVHSTGTRSYTKTDEGPSFWEQLMSFVLTFMAITISFCSILICMAGYVHNHHGSRHLPPCQLPVPTLVPTFDNSTWGEM